MSKVSVVAFAIALAACEAPFWVKEKREDRQIARQEAIRAQEHETWRAEERRRLLALCLDIAKFERQWANFDEWSYNVQTGGCTVWYKKTGAAKKTEKECADLWLNGKDERMGDGPSDKAPEVKQRLFYDCAAENFSKVWNVQLANETSP